MELENFEEGDRVLFNDRARPLTVVEAGEELLVEGPNGGRYVIYSENDAMLVSRPDNRRYSSYCEDLRKVGEWERSGDRWKHSKTGSLVEIFQMENGFFQLRVEGLEVDLPAYGFTDKESAVEKAEKVVRDRPEG